MPHVVIATWTAQAGQAEKIKDIIQKMTAPSLGEEGCLMYVGHQVLDEENVFVIYEQYRDAEAYQDHTSSDHFRRFVVGEAAPRLVSRVRTFCETI